MSATRLKYFLLLYNYFVCVMNAIVTNITSPQESRSIAVNILGSTARVTFKLAHATALAVSGVGLMMFGGYSGHLLYQQTSQFYGFAENASGYANIPGFNKTCTVLTDFVHRQTGYPEQNSLFCETFGSKPFDEQGIYGPASLACSLGISMLGGIGSVYAFFGGLALIGKSFEVFLTLFR